MLLQTATNGMKGYKRFLQNPFLSLKYILSKFQAFCDSHFQSIVLTNTSSGSSANCGLNRLRMKYGLLNNNCSAGRNA